MDYFIEGNVFLCKDLVTRIVKGELEAVSVTLI